LVLDNNLYWNGGAPIPPGEVVSPLMHDLHRVIGDPLFARNTLAVTLPRWNGFAFLSGSHSIRQEFLRLVILYGAILPGSAAIEKADPERSPAEDILGRTRRNVPDLGAYEHDPYFEVLPYVKNGR
jgi:hypothetical protein